MYSSCHAGRQSTVNVGVVPGMGFRPARLGELCPSSIRVSICTWVKVSGAHLLIRYRVEDVSEFVEGFFGGSEGCGFDEFVSEDCSKDSRCRQHVDPLRSKRLDQYLPGVDTEGPEGGELF